MLVVQLKEAQRLVKRVNKRASVSKPYVVKTYLYDNGGIEVRIKTQSIFNGSDTRELILGLFSLGLYVWLSSENGCPVIIAS